MTSEQFRLTLAICAIIAALAYLGSVDPVLMVIVVFLGFCRRRFGALLPDDPLDMAED